MDDNVKDAQNQGVSSKDAERMNKLQKEMDELEKRAKKELEGQRPSFSTVEMEDKPSLSAQEEKVEPQVINNQTEQAPVPDAQSVTEEPQVTESVEGYSQPEVPQPPSESDIQEESVGSSVQEPVQEPSQDQVSESGQEQEVESKVEDDSSKPKDSGKSAKVIFWIAVFLFIVCLTAIGAYYVGFNNSDTQLATPAPTPLTRATPEPTETPAPVSLTYTNEIYNYSFIYSEGWQIMPDLQAPEEIVSATSNENSFTVYAGSKRITVPGDAELEGEEVLVDVGGLSATKASYTGLYEVITLPDNDSEVNMIVIRYKNGNRTTEYKNAFDEMLSSFQLLGEPTSEPLVSPEPESSPSASPEAGQ